jgi:hypothetical protein
MAAAVTTVHGKEECLCCFFYLKTEGDATPAARTQGEASGIS